jgi:CheY-like chemotaxis protein
VSAELDGADAVVKVTDDGIGIPAEMLHSIFDMFTQLDRSLERSHSGLGIGLTLVKRLIEMHGGSVAAFSDGQDRGARFEIRLPALAASHAPPPVQASPKTVASARKRILVVDDNRDNADSLSLLLKIGGHDSYAIHDGHEAIEAAERLRPDMILLDIAMPKLNGLDVCTRIREMPWGKDMMVVAVTGWGQDADRRKSKEAGFDFHLVKPIVEADIARLLSRLGQ